MQYQTILEYLFGAYHNDRSKVNSPDDIEWLIRYWSDWTKFVLSDRPLLNGKLIFGQSVWSDNTFPLISPTFDDKLYQLNGRILKKSFELGARCISWWWHVRLSLKGYLASLPLPPPPLVPPALILLSTLRIGLHQERCITRAVNLKPWCCSDEWP